MQNDEMNTSNDRIADAAAAEIRRFHDVLVAWFTGQMNESEFDTAIADVLHPEFAWVSPSGQDISRDQILEGLKSGYGSNPEFRITVEDIELELCEGDLAVVSYVENQTGARNAPPVNTRRSSVVFSLKPRLAWRYLHETYRE